MSWWSSIRKGIVLWRDGPKKIQQHAERLGFEVGANWSERSVGTNAIGTALVVSRPVQIYSAEHFVKTHHAWTCAAAPILDPVNGTLLGVVDVSGAAATVHPTTLALVDAAARMAESFLREEHHAAMGALRAVAAPLLAGSRQPTMVTDADGWVAAASTATMAADRRIALPDDRDSDVVWLPASGIVPAGTGAGRLAGPGADRRTGRRRPPPRSRSTCGTPPTQPEHAVPAGHWTHRLSPRHAELLFLLAVNPNGRSAGQLSEELYGSAEHAVAVRAEMSRLRKHLGGVLCQRPYRFADWAQVRVDSPDRRRPTCCRRPPHRHSRLRSPLGGLITQTASAA